MSLQHTPALDTGMVAPDFRLPATDGRFIALEGVRGTHGMLVVFMCNHCPYVVAVRERLVEDCAELLASGIGVVAISSNDPEAYPEDSFERMAVIAREWHLPFPYLYDEDQSVARAYGAVCTPDFFGFDRDLRLRYRGRLDAAHRGPRTPGMARELVEAMHAVASGHEVPADQHPSMGCSIKWRRT